MTPLGSLVPYPALSVSLVAIWLMLNNSASPGHVLLGVVLGVLIPLVTRRIWPERPPFHKLPLLWRLFFTVNRDILQANATVAWLTLTRPTRRLRPCFFVVPLEIRDPYALTLLTWITTMTPGSVVADLDEAGGLLLIHALDEPDPERAAARIKARYERPLKEIFE